jgi:glycerol-3-phosphate dehydrogenase
MEGFITITGGKLMTYRLMAQWATDAVCRKQYTAVYHGDAIPSRLTAIHRKTLHKIIRSGCLCAAQPSTAMATERRRGSVKGVSAAAWYASVKRLPQARCNTP